MTSDLAARPVIRSPSLFARFLFWWSAELARVGDKAGVQGKPWHAMALHRGGVFEIYLRRGKAQSLVGTIDPGGSADDHRAVAADILRHGGGDRMVLRLDPADVVRTRTVLPSGVRDVIDQVLLHQLERLAPWPADQALFDYSEIAPTADHQHIEIDLWVAGKAHVEALLADLARVGLRPATVDVGSEPTPTCLINLVSAAGDSETRRQRRVQQRLATAGALTVILMGCGLGAMAWLHQQNRATERAVRTAFVAAAAASQPRATELQRQQAAVLDKRRTLPAITIVVEALSRSLPDDVVLERIETRDGILTISGSASNPPALVGLLEGLPQFAEVQFAAPTTRQSGDKGSLFSISARLVAQPRWASP